MQRIYLLPAIFGQFDSMVGYHLVDGSIFVALRLGMAN